MSAVVGHVATATLGTAERMAFFRELGRTYGVLGGLALLAALIAGAVLAAGRSWNGLLTASAVLAATLVGTTGAGIVQARRMTRLRVQVASGAAGAPGQGVVQRAAGRAAVPRALIAVLSVALVVLGVLGVLVVGSSAGR